MAYSAFLSDLNRRLQRGFRDPALKAAVLETFVKGEKQMFRRQADWRGRPWKGLAPSTIRRKGHARIGRDTGRLHRSLTRRGGLRVQVSRRGISISTKVRYARYFDRTRPVWFEDPEAFAEAVAAVLAGDDSWD